MFTFDEPFGSTLFCDDIRYENGGKQSYIGCYQGGIFIPSFPVIVPRFGIAIFFNEPRDWAERRDWGVPIHVLLPGDPDEKPSFVGEIPAITSEQMNAAFQTSIAEDPGVPHLVQAAIQIIMSPMVVQMPGRIKVRAIYRDYVVKLGTIRVEPPPTTPAVISLPTTNFPVLPPG
jgi:hypothetical protein